VQVLRNTIPTFERVHKIDNSAPPLAQRDLTVAIYGHVELVSEDHSSTVVLHATSYQGNRANPESGRFQTVRFKPTSGRAKTLQFAEMMLIFDATLGDGARHQLVLVRNFTQTQQRSSIISGVECSDTLLQRGGFSVIRLTDLVDAYHIVPDVNYPKDPTRFVANRHILSRA